jgi:hypothetical protein
MHKLVSGVFAVLFLAACSGTPGSGTPAITVPPSAANAALTQLCSGTGDASLAGLGARLEAFDPATVDATQLQVAAGAVSATLAQLQLTADQTILRDAAVAAIQSVQGAQVDRATALQAAGAIRALETAIC